MKELPLLYLTIEVTNYCNLNCRICFKKGLKEMPYKHMTLEMFIKILDESKPTKGVTFVGLGEPLLNPDFYEMLKETRKRNLIINMVTNGTLMDKEWCKKLVALKVDKISISLDAATKKTYDNIRINGNFDKIIENIKMLVNMKKESGLRYPGIRLDMVLIKSNLHELSTLVKLAIDLETNAVGTLHPQCLLKGLEKEHITEMDPVEIIKYYNEAVAHTLATKLPLSLRQIDVTCTGCNTPWMNPYIDVYGNIYPCCIMGTIKNKAIEYFKDAPINLDMSNMVMGNINSDNFKKIWSNDKYNNFRNECAIIFNEQLESRRQKKITMSEYIQLRKDNIDCKNYCKVCGLRFGMVC